MQSLRFSILTALLLSACASQTHVSSGIAEPRWAQRPDEAKRLPVGKVIFIARSDLEPTPAIAKPVAAGNSATNGQVDLGTMNQFSARKSNYMYRHRVALLSGTIQEVEVEYKFSVGDCVAIRNLKASNLTTVQIVEALPGACD